MLTFGVMSNLFIFMIMYVVSEIPNFHEQKKKKKKKNEINIWVS